MPRRLNREEQTRLFDAAERVLASARAECEGQPFDEMELLHTIVMTVVDEHRDAGLVTGDEPHVDAVTASLSQLAAMLDVARMRRAL